MHPKLRLMIGVFIALLAVGSLVLLLGKLPEAAEADVDRSLMDRMEEAAEVDVSYVAERVQVAESSRKQAIQDSIADSIAESVSVRESIEESVRISVEESVAESVSIEESILASLEESEAEIRRAEQRSREEAAAASLAAAREAEEKRAAEAAAAASRWAAEHPGETVTGLVVLLGDSRASGFAAYNCWPADRVFYSYSQITAHYDNFRRAAAMIPEMAVFSHGVDDLISYGLERSRNEYEKAIRYFLSLSPNTKIAVVAVPPCVMTGTVASRYPVLAHTAEYNALLQDMCARNGWRYVDGTAGFSSAYVAADGIHFTAGWTRQWLANIRAQAGF